MWSSHTGKEDKIASSMVSAMTRDTLDAVGAKRETESLPQAVEVTDAFLKMTAKQSSRMSGNEADLEVREGCSPQMVRHIQEGGWHFQHLGINLKTRQEWQVMRLKTSKDV